MRRQIIPAAEIERNKRVKELMANKIQRPSQPKTTLTEKEMEEVNELRAKGYTRDEAVKIILSTNNILNKYESNTR